MKYDNRTLIDAAARILGKLNDCTGQVCSGLARMFDATSDSLNISSGRILLQDNDSGASIRGQADTGNDSVTALPSDSTVSGWDKRGKPITFPAELVICRQFFDADGKPIGMGCPINPNDELIPGWASARDRESDSHYRHILEARADGGSYGPGIEASWYQEGHNPVYRQVHSDGDYYSVALDRGDGDRQIVTVTGSGLARIDLAKDMFHQALDSNAGSPILLLGCRTFSHDSGAGPTLAAAWHSAGVDRDVWGSPLLVGPQPIDAEDSILGVIAEEGKPDWKVRHYREPER
ncbi:hypothetical protein [Nocardia sp. CC201C]|uniref:hypothetical protein n=1 Tax=Nocardia sp. CC201C TaxID=3044575 RepID=UPI0024A9E70F|nr:hypothetical protein [Nocardia sp. CC201C]